MEVLRDIYSYTKLCAKTNCYYDEFNTWLLHSRRIWKSVGKKCNSVKPLGIIEKVRGAVDVESVHDGTKNWASTLVPSSSSPDSHHFKSFVYHTSGLNRWSSRNRTSKDRTAFGQPIFQIIFVIFWTLVKALFERWKRHKFIDASGNKDSRTMIGASSKS
jgi:hypothetical protein